MKHILLTGASGFLGSYFCHLYADQYDIQAIYNDNPVQNKHVNSHKVDLSDFQGLESLFKKIKPDEVVHLAALSDPNYCEINPLESEKINIEVSENIAGLCKEAKIPFLFTSTDLVFDGKNAPYKESDVPAPVSIYGLHKSIAEQSILDIYPMATVCRLPLMFGKSYSAKEGILQYMLTKMASGETLNLFTDEYRTFASVRDICNGIMTCLEYEGDVFHLGGSERMSRYDFGLLVCDVFGFDKSLLIKSKQKEVKMAAARPKDVSMINARATGIGWNPGNIRNELSLIKKEMEAGL